MNYKVFDNSYCINIKTDKRALLVQEHDNYYSPSKNEDGAIFEIVSDPYCEEVNIIGGKCKTYKFINVKSSLTGNVYRVLYKESQVYNAYKFELIPNPYAPKMISLDKVCEFLKTLTYQEYPGGPLERKIDDNDLEKLRKKFE